MYGRPPQPEGNPVGPYDDVHELIATVLDVNDLATLVLEFLADEYVYTMPPDVLSKVESEHVKERIKHSPTRTTTTRTLFGRTHSVGDAPSIHEADDDAWIMMEWHFNGEPWRLDGDCTERVALMDMYTWRNRTGDMHREGDLPARVSATCMEWRINGNLHRSGGKPAIVCANRDCYYHGKPLMCKKVEVDGGYRCLEWWTNGVNDVPPECADYNDPVNV